MIRRIVVIGVGIFGGIGNNASCQAFSLFHRNTIKQDIAQQSLTLNGIIYHGPHDWVVWINGIKYTPKVQCDDLTIIKVTPRDIQGVWRKNQLKARFFLRVGKSYTLH